MSTLNDEDRDNLVAYLDGELDEEAAQALEAKISLDPEARREVEALRQAWGMLDYMPRPQPSVSFTHRTMERLSLEKMALAASHASRPRRGKWRRVLGWAAAFGLLAVLGYGAAHFLQPSENREQDELLIRHLRVLEKWQQLQHVDDLEFLRGLDHPDLFGEEPGR